MLIKKIFWRPNTPKAGRFGESSASSSDVCIKCLLLNNRRFPTRPTVVKKKIKQPFLYLFIVSANKFGASFNTIDNPYTQAHLSSSSPDKVKNMKVNVFNVISSVNETNFLV